MDIMYGYVWIWDMYGYVWICMDINKHVVCPAQFKQLLQS